jgi:hypothetical protein
LYERIGSRYRRSHWSRSDAIDRASKTIAQFIGENIELPKYPAFRTAFDAFQKELLAQIFSPMQIEFLQPPTLRGQMELNTQLRDRKFFFEHEEQVCEAIGDAFHQTARLLSGALPSAEPSGLTIPLITVVRDPAALIEALVRIFFTSQHYDLKVFTTIANKLYENLCRASGTSPGSEKPVVFSTQAQIKPDKLIDAYLAETPLHALLSAPYPFQLPAAQRFAGHWIIAPPGRGKTTLLHAMVNDDLLRDAAITCTGRR